MLPIAITQQGDSPTGVNTASQKYRPIEFSQLNALSFIARTSARGLMTHIKYSSISPGNRRYKQLGAATAMDFMLTFPLFAFLLLFFIQMALVLHAYTVIQYSAYVAARSARVQALDSDHAFRDLELGKLKTIFDNAPNVIKGIDLLTGKNLSGIQDNIERIHAAAMNQLVSISPASKVYATGNTGNNWNETSYSRYVAAVVKNYGSNRVAPIVRKARYAYDPENTKVKISFLPDQFKLGDLRDLKVINAIKNTPLDSQINLPVFITVEYRYELQIPIGRTFFANDDQRPYGRWMTATVNLM